MKKEQKKSIPLKNYIIVVVMFLSVMLVVFGLRSWYRTYKKYQLTIPVINGKLSEVKLNELKDYITAHDDFYMYVGTASNEKCRELEKKLVKLLSKKNIKNETVYLNMTNNDSDTLQKVLSEELEYNEKNEYPVFIIINNNKVLGVASDNKNNMGIDSIEKLLDEFEIGK